MDYQSGSCTPKINIIIIVTQYIFHVHLYIERIIYAWNLPCYVLSLHVCISNTLYINTTQPFYNTIFLGSSQLSKPCFIKSLPLINASKNAAGTANSIDHDLTAKMWVYKIGDILFPIISLWGFFQTFKGS